ncbi:MAG: restriction endonuclease subunit S [archaeon]|nr:restriction endonuclease subunit S [archaeon]
MKLGDLFSFEKKSKIKASQGESSGKYKFFTSSVVQNKFLDEYIFDKESLIFGTGGQPSIHYCNEKFATSTDCFVIYENNGLILPKFVYYYLLNNIYILENGFKGAGLKHISKKYLQNIEILFPRDINIQQQIVEKIENIEELITYRNNSLELLDLYLKSVFFKMFGNPILNEMEWDLYKFKQVGTLQRGKSKHRPRNAPELLGGDYPLIQTGDVSNSGNYIYDYYQTYSELGLKQSKMWSKGTLCITIAANIAKTGILTFDACFPDSIVGFIPNDYVCVEYVQFWMSFLQKILESTAPESAQKNINLKILNDLNIPVPPIELQNQFAEIVKQVEEIKKYQLESKKELENLFNNLMQKAFKGELIC